MMKRKLVFTGLMMLFLIEVPSIAQTEKGKFVLGGDTKLSFASAKVSQGTQYYETGSSKVQSFEFTPQFGFFPVKDLALGLGIRYSYDNTTISYNEYKSTSFYLLPYAQLYFGNSNVKPFLFASAGIGTGTNVETGYNSSWDNTKKSLFLYEAGGGFAIFANDMVSIELGIAYSAGTSKYDNYGEARKDKASGIGANIGIVLIL